MKLQRLLVFTVESNHSRASERWYERILYDSGPSRRQPHGYSLRVFDSTRFEHSNGVVYSGQWRQLFGGEWVSGTPQMSCGLPLGRHHLKWSVEKVESVIGQRELLKARKPKNNKLD